MDKFLCRPTAAVPARGPNASNGNASGKVPKRPPSPDKHDKANYEKFKRPCRTFSSDWQVGRDWLIFDKAIGKMKSSMCVQYYQAVVLVPSQRDRIPSF